MNSFNLNQQIEFCGKRMTVQEFGEINYPEATEQNLENVIDLLIAKGSIKAVHNKSKEQKAFERIAKEQNLKAQVDQHDTFNEEFQDAMAQEKRTGHLTHGSVEYDFPNLLMAQEYQLEIEHKLRLDDSQIIIGKGIVTVVFNNVTDAEITTMSRIYKTDRFVAKTMNYANKGANMATSAVHYAATKIAAPSAQVLARTGMNLLKTLVTTGVKTGSTFITAASQGIKEAKSQLSCDPDVLKATNELIETKDSIKRTINSFTSGSHGGSGIRVNR